MTHNLTPQQLDVLRQIQGGADPAQFSTKLINGLVKAQLLQDVPNGLALTDDALEAVASTIWYMIQQQHHKLWITVPNERPFADLEAAERRAAQYSVQAEVLIRVVPETVEPATFTVFDFGKRYTQDASTGARIADPGFRKTDDDFLDEGHFYVVQRRTPHHHTDGQFATWELLSERHYVDVDLAIDHARNAAEGDEPYEYRIAVAESLDLPPVVYYRGQALPDLGLLDQLAQVGAGQLPSTDPLPVLKQTALGLMLSDWALHNPKDILNICAAALEPDSTLSDQVRELRDTL